MQPGMCMVLDAGTRRCRTATMWIISSMGISIIRMEITATITDRSK
jgi:hypothetical protein